MIALLIKAVTKTPIDGMGQGHFWQQGEIVDIRNHRNWGNLEILPDFWRVVIDEINFDDPVVQEWLRKNTPVPNEEPISRRLYYLDIAALPPPVRNGIESGVEYIVPPSRLQGFRDAMTIRTA